MFNFSKNHIRWTIRRDFPEILEIESTTAKPLQEEQLIEALRKRSVIGMVAERGEKVVGHFIYELKENRLVLLRLAVHPEFQKEGVGRAMIERLITKLSSSRRNRLVVYVPDDNLGLQLFFKKLGFKATRVKNDKYVMEYSVVPENQQVDIPVNRISVFTPED